MAAFQSAAREDWMGIRIPIVVFMLPLERSGQDRAIRAPQVAQSMVRRPLSFETVSVAVVAGTIHSSVALDLDHPQFGSARIRRLSREARTASQCKTLANFYETRRRMYVRKAAEQMHSLSKRMAQPGLLMIGDEIFMSFNCARRPNRRHSADVTIGWLILV